MTVRVVILGRKIQSFQLSMDQNNTCFIVVGMTGMYHFIYSAKPVLVAQPDDLYLNCDWLVSEPRKGGVRIDWELGVPNFFSPLPSMRTLK